VKSPYPYFGGKATVATEVWKRFGDVGNYLEPFFGSGAVLLSRPHKIASQVETVNDLDSMIANFWRAVSKDPEAVAEYADWPVNEADLHARHCWLLGRKPEVADRCMGDPDWYDAKVAGWWVWGICCWIGSGWCSGNGSWVSRDGLLVEDKDEDGASRQIPHLGSKGMGVHRKRPHLGDKGMGVHRTNSDLLSYFLDLQERMRRVRVCCGDWTRILGDTVTEKHGATIGVFLDPPYSVEDREDCYNEESRSLSHDVRAWALERGADKRYRIALCGYEGEHEMPGWNVVEWKAKGGYASQSDKENVNARRERIWFSPGCLKPMRSMQLNIL